MDGAVLKLEDLALAAAAGATARAPRAQLAHKFPAQQTVTRIAGVDVSVGAAGPGRACFLAPKRKQLLGSLVILEGKEDNPL